ncbi:MAG: EAL domain-containing protein [Lachnospiraceae bacterium]|nr:EAL domain-containing protein [Lachnospiraceae bacterium]
MVLEFDYAALMVLGLILITIFRKKLHHGRTNRLFIYMVVVSIVVTLTDLLPYVLFELPLTDPIKRGAYTALFYAYFYLRSFTILVYLLFCLSKTRMWYRLHYRFTRFAVVAPYLVTFLLVTSNFFHHRLFSVDPYLGYARGELMPFLYISSGFYLIYVVGFTVYCMKNKLLEPDRWLALSILVVFTGIAVLIQMFHGEYLVEMFFTSLSLMAVLLYIQRPEEYVDSVNGVMNYKVYKREIKKILATGERAQIFMIRFKAARTIREYLGAEVYSEQIMGMLDSLVAYFKGTGHEFDFFYEEPGNIYIVMDNSEDILTDDKVVEFARMVLTQSVIDERNGLTLDAVMAMVFAPDDMADEESIINFGHKFVQFTDPGHHLVRAADVVGTREFHILNNMDDILRRAVSQGSFEMYYQPIYSLRKGKFISAEALIRLHDPDYGMISPGVFIPEAEQRHLMQAVGIHVLHDVIEFIGSRDFEGLGLSYIELNLSGQQCIDKNIVNDIVGYQKKFGVSPEQINLEITETDYEDDNAHFMSNLSELSDCGFALSLDDFGTGYSNIQRILRLPLDIIKFDKTMIDSMESLKGESVIKNAIVLMQDIGMEIVAEGVEEWAQVDKLKKMGCDYIQGYYFAKPMPRDEFVTFLRKNNNVL